MTFFDNLMLGLDEGVTGLFAQWNLYSSIIVALFAGLLTYQVATRTDPDVHPYLLARQASGSPVRNEGESPVYRSQSAPHGMPLNTGLNVREPGASKWSRGRDGDLRDIWWQAVSGPKETTGGRRIVGTIFTILGAENITEHHVDDLTRQINLIGQHILDQGGNRVAIYLPNSVELIVTLFACAFYNLTAVILPFNQSEDAVISMLRRSAADTVVTAPGSFPFDHVVKSYPSLRQLIWVVDEGSRHMDWNEVPQGTGGSVNVSTWQDIVTDYPVDAGKDLPPYEGQKEARDVTIFWQSKPGTVEEMVRFTSGNLLSAVSAQLHGGLPGARKLDPSDIFLPADSLANTFTLVLTLAALYSNSHVAFSSVGAEANDLAIATRCITPSVLVATPAALLKTCEEGRVAGSSFIARQLHWLLTRTLTQKAVMPRNSFVSNLYSRFRPTIGPTPGSLRLIYTAERVGAGTPPLSSQVLSDMRVFAGAHVVYALTAAKVAGAVAQTTYCDYRVFDDQRLHFGPPLSSTEILLKDSSTHKNSDGESKGEIIVRGPAVSGGEAALGVDGMILDDGTLAYA